ncbi:MAG: ester cyclase [Candidatus Eiseniibacteriota bacterium]
MITRGTSWELMIAVLVLLLVAAFVIAGCGRTRSEVALERNKRLVRKMNAEVWNNNNLSIVDQLYAPDFVLHFLPDGTESIGIDSLREHVRQLRRAFPDWSEEIQRIVAERDMVVIHYVSTGTNQGPWLGNPPTGKRIQINEVSMFRVKEGRIAEQWLLPDTFGMRQQLGVTGNE